MWLKCVALLSYCCPMPSTALLRALSDGEDLRSLPDDATSLLLELDAPPRLAAHLRAVHQAAWELTDSLTRAFPKLAYDREAILFRSGDPRHWQDDPHSRADRAWVTARTGWLP